MGTRPQGPEQDKQGWVMRLLKGAGIFLETSDHFWRISNHFHGTIVPLVVDAWNSPEAVLESPGD